jgi:hypothetical protein
MNLGFSVRAFLGNTVPFLRAGYLLAVLFLLFSNPIFAQQRLVDAGVYPESVEIKAWEDFEPSGAWFCNLDLELISPTVGGDTAVFGYDGLGPCGTSVSGVRLTGAVNQIPGLVPDGEDGEFSDVIGPVIVSQASGSGGFADGIAGSAANVISIHGLTAVGMQSLAEIIGPTHVISATAYVGRNGPMGIWQVSGLPPYPGQVVPSENIENSPARAVGTGASRVAGIGGFRNTRMVVATEDLTGGDPGAVFGFPNPGKSVLVLTLYDYENGPQIVKPTFAYPFEGRNSPAHQSVAPDRIAFPTGWFTVRTAINTAALFYDDGSILANLGDYLSQAPLPLGIIELEPGGTDRSIAAGGEHPFSDENRAFIAVRGVDEGGIHHPCAVMAVVQPVGATATVTKILQLDSDIPGASDFADGSAMDLAVLSNGALFAVWRNFPSQSPVARFFDSNGDPMTPTFWVSTLEGNDTNTGETTIKCSINEGYAVVCWLSESFQPGTNCAGRHHAAECHGSLLQKSVVRTPRYTYTH